MNRPLVLLVLFTAALVALTLSLTQTDGAPPDTSVDGKLIDADFYVIQTYKYDHVAITYDDQRVGAAIREWAKYTVIEDGGLVATEQADIKLVFPDPWPFGPGVLGAAGPNLVGPGKIVIQCTIYETQAFAVLGVLIHEAGHCLGLGHSAVPSGAMYPYCCNSIAPDDVNGIGAIYGVSTKPTPMPPTPPFVPATATTTRVPTPTATPTPSTYRLRIPQLARD